jgi:two-component system sensor histidine kinase HydH
MKRWQWRRFVGLATVVACGAFAAWQYREFDHERLLARHTLIQQTASVRQALLAGIRSHRRMGWFFESQLQTVLDELVQSPAVVAVTIEDEGGQQVMSAGPQDRLTGERVPELWQPAGLQTSRALRLRLEPAGGPGGRGPAWMRGERPQVESRRLLVTLLMDRSATDASIRRAARLRSTVAVAGFALIGSVALAWRGRMRSLRAKARSELLRVEAQRLQDLGQAAAGLAHETRNPLGVIRGGLQRLLHNGANREGNGQIGLLVEECDRITARLNQFLAYARPRSPDRSVVDLLSMFRDLESLLQPDLEAKRLELRVDCDRADCRVEADPDMLRQILFNLLQNASGFSPAGATIEVTVRGTRTGRARIEVADRGPGVAAADRESLFRPYFTTRADGTGLGLAIVSRLAQAHDWHVGFHERNGGGSVFTIDGIGAAASPAGNPDR